MKLNSIFSLLFICTYFHTQCQILNIEKNRLDKDTSEFWGGNLGLNFSLFNRSAAEDAPVNLVSFNTRVNLLYKKNRNNYIFISQIDYLRINENPFLNTGYFHGRIHFLTDRKWSYEIFTQYQYDNFRQLNPRILAGGTPRLRIRRDSTYTIYAGIGLMFESEFWTHPQSGELVNLNLLKSTNYLSVRTKFNEIVDLNAVTYYQVGFDPAITDFRHRINFMFNLLARITRRLSFNFTFNYQWEDKPITPITPVIYNISNGITVRF